MDHGSHSKKFTKANDTRLSIVIKQSQKHRRHTQYREYLHHQTGMPRSMPGPMLYFTEPEGQEEAASGKTAKETQTTET